MKYNGVYYTRLKTKLAISSVDKSIIGEKQYTKRSDKTLMSQNAT